VIAATTRDDHGVFVIWRIQDGRAESFPTAALVHDAEFGPEPERLRVATAHADGAVRIWQIDPDPPDDLRGDPAAIWLSWQQKLGLTLDEHAQIRQLDGAPRRARSRPTGCEHEVKAR
jgi:hypothetical protein